MLSTAANRVGYVVKRYPCLTQTVLLNEILAHELTGLDVEIFSLRPPNDAHFQDRVSLVRAPVSYVPAERVLADRFWEQSHQAGHIFPTFWSELELCRGEDVADIHQAISVARDVRERSITHLHAHGASTAASVARLAARLAGISYSVTIRERDLYHDDVRLEQLQPKLDDATAVIANCDFNKRYLREMLSSTSVNVHRVYNGLDLDDYRFNSPKDRAPHIVAVGRLVEKKGFEDLIEACGILAGRDRHFTCQIIGGGELDTNLHAQVRRLGLQSRFEFSGPRPQGEVIRAVQNATVLAVPLVVRQ